MSAHAVLIVDQAGWHLTPKLAPELNPVENVWQFMRDNWLRTGSEDIVARKIMSLGMRKWAHGF